MHYKRCIENMFVLLQSPQHLEKFNEYLNTKHANEKEAKGSLSFLDVLISNKGFITSLS